MLETMACNLIPVCTETGWASDVIEDGKNGFILKENYNSSNVRTALMKARMLDLDIRSTVRQYTYERYINNFIN
jgi:glycosyltransferase involved in cell wall biosynthesis